MNENQSQQPQTEIPSTPIIQPHVPERVITLNPTSSPPAAKTNENKIFIIFLVVGIILLISVVIFALFFMSSSNPKGKQFIDYQYQFSFSNTSGWEVTDPEGDNFFALQTTDTKSLRLSYVGITAYPKLSQKDFSSFFKEQNTKTCVNIGKAIGYQTQSFDYQNGDLSGQICSGEFINKLTNTKMSLNIYNLASPKTKYVYSVATRYPLGNTLEKKKVEVLIKGFKIYTE